MNIFAVDPNPRRAAQALVDQHVVKMPLETAQILSTVYRESEWLPSYEWLYAPTHESHPVVEWAGASLDNLCWTIMHAVALGREFEYRFDDTHSSHETVIVPLASTIHPLCWNDHDPFAMAVPNQYQVVDPVAAYREYYRAEKVPEMGEWTNRDPPAWALQVVGDD